MTAGISSYAQNMTGLQAQQAGSALGAVSLAAGHSLTPVTRRLVRPMVGEASCATRNCRMAFCLPGCRGTTEAPVSCAGHAAAPPELDQHWK